MAEDLNDINDFGSTDDVIRTNVGEGSKKGSVQRKSLPDSEGGTEDNKEQEGNSQQGKPSDEKGEQGEGQEKSDSDNEPEQELDKEGTQEGEEEKESDGSEDSSGDENEDDVETKKPDGYSEDEQTEGDEDKGEEKDDNSKKDNKNNNKDPEEGNVCLGLNALREDENSLGILKTKKDGLYVVRFPETNEIKELERSNIVFANDYVSFYIGGRLELGYITAFNVVGRTCNIINWKSNEKWNDVDVNDIYDLAKEDDGDANNNEQEQQQDEENQEDEATREQEELEQQNLKRFKSLQFFVKFFLDSKKQKSYREYIRRYKFGDWSSFHHQSFWLLNKKIVDALDVLSVFNEEAGDDLSEFISLDNSIMLNINMISLKNQDILKELSDIKNIPKVLYRILDERTSLKDFESEYTSEMDKKLNYKINLAYFGRKIFFFTERVHNQESVLKNFIVLNVDKSNKRIFGKVRNSESDKYIFNVYFSDFEKISYYEIFSYICYVLIWRYSKTNQITDYSEIVIFVKKYLTTAKEILI